MIPIVRGEEPGELGAIRDAQLAILRSVPAGSMPKISGYRICAETLWKVQHFKCCYCENKIIKSFNDVEHFRPKGSANRLPGCTSTHGYWWLAFSWDNLLYACPLCNRSNKNDSFPLESGPGLTAENVPPGTERPFLLDPGSDVNPCMHIEFVSRNSASPNGDVDWRATPRQNSPRGSYSIEIFGLNHQEQIEMRSDYFNSHLKTYVTNINIGLNNNDENTVSREFNRALLLLEPQMPHVAFASDVLRVMIDEEQLNNYGCVWPDISEVGCPS